VLTFTGSARVACAAAAQGGSYFLIPLVFYSGQEAVQCILYANNTLVLVLPNKGK
jgi:hypothetical protein